MKKMVNSTLGNGAMKPPHSLNPSSGGFSEERDEYIIAYDLPSENYVEYKDSKMYSIVRATRVRCITKLHNLGVLTTESVVLSCLPINKINNVIKEIEDEYHNLNKILVEKGFSALPKPLIKVIKLVKEQKEEFKDLAEKRLKERLDEIIERLVKIINDLDMIIEEKEIEKMTNNLNKQSRELRRLEKLAKEIGLETNNKFDLISELYYQIIKRLEERKI